MNISSNSKLVRWAYWAPWFEDRRPKQISLCMFFWQAFLFAAISNTITALLLLPVLYTVIGIHTALKAFDRRLMSKIRRHETQTERYARWDREEEMKQARRERWARRRARFFNSVFWQGLKTIKGKVCPIIYISD